MEVDQFDFNCICRTCKIESTETRSIFESFENCDGSTPIHEMLMACATVQIDSDDELPTIICEKCVQKLQSAYFFKKQCENTDTSLREYAKCMKENAVKEELQSQNSEINNYVENFLATNSMLTTDNVLGGASDENLPVPPAVPQKDFIELLENNQMLLTCSECGKVFTTLEGLKCHKRLHTGALFKCKFCDKEYTRQNHLHRHETSHSRRKVHVCRICNKTLTRLEHLKRHLTTHLKEKPFSCTRCKRGFNRSEHLENHVVRCKGDRVHICDICNKGFNRSDSLEVHKKLHENQRPVLPTLDNLDNISDHYYEIDFDANMVFSDNSDDVDDCFEPQVEVLESLDEDKIREVATLSEDSELKVQITSTLKEELEEDGKEQAEPKQEPLEHREENSRDSNIDEDVEERQEEFEDLVDIDTEEYEPVEPTINQEVAREEDSDSAHSEYLPSKNSPKVKRGRGRPRKHPIMPSRPRGRPPNRHGKVKNANRKAKKIKSEDEEFGDFPCPSCGEHFPVLKLLENHAAEKHPGIKLYKCKNCEKDFSCSNHLKRHMLSHSMEKPHVCIICTKSFNRKDHLTQHMKLHSKMQQITCEVCLKTFHRADHLAKHKASKHNIGEKVISEKKFECSVCSKNFTTEKYRDVHLRGHMGMKRFECKTCEKSFHSKSHLTEHMKFHNENSKKFLCSECGQRFIRNDYLVIHMRRHRGEKPFKCKFCGKGFPRTTDLTVHERYHTGEKTHLCTICGRGFGRAYNLTVHMRTHTGEKPYQCTYCDAAFAQGNDLKAHVRRHTGERFQCELCSDSFLMGYLLTQHKRTIHGLNVVSNIRRLQPVSKLNPDNPDEPPPVTIPLPKPVIPDTILSTLQAQLNVAHLHHMAQE